MREAVIHIGRNYVRDGGSFYFYDSFSLLIDGCPLTTSRHATGSYQENCLNEGRAIAEIMTDTGIREYRIGNGREVTDENAVRNARPIPREGVTIFEDALKEKGCQRAA